MTTCRTLVIALAVIGMSFRSLSACSIFMISGENVVLVGNNEDWSDPNGKVRFVPSTEGRHGIVYFGHSNGFAQGGMNDQGLFFDYAATDRLEVTQSTDKPEVASGTLMDKVMAECGTVDEALAVFDKYDLRFMEKHQTLICDRNGDSAIIEGDEIIRKKGRFQVVTNFYQSKIKSKGVLNSVASFFQSNTHPTSIQCKRYKTASAMLAKMNRPSVEGMRDVLAAVHQEGKYSTQYSNVYDLTNGVVYTYHFHNFTNVVKLDLKEELAKGARTVDLPSLFPRTPRYDAVQRRESSKRMAGFRSKAEGRSASASDLNAYAWELLTSKDEDLRDASTALRLAKKAVAESDEKLALILDTLGLAYSMTGDKLKAVETQRRAVSLLPPGDSPARSELEARLAQFEADVSGG